MTRQGATERLTILWLAMPVPPAVLLTVQTLSGKYGSDSADAWAWLLAQLAPVLALVMAAASSTASRTWREKPANLFRWRCAAATSALYGAAIFGLLLAEPLLTASSYEIFAGSAWSLALLQGLVVACLGAVIFDGR